jgi:excisionase family DNA binding protein
MPLKKKNQQSVKVSSVLALPKLLNIKEVAHFLNVSVRTVHTIIKTKQLTYFRVRGQLRFDPIHIDQYLQKRMVRAFP